MYVCVCVHTLGGDMISIHTLAGIWCESRRIQAGVVRVLVLGCTLLPDIVVVGRFLHTTFPCVGALVVERVEC